jgi:signal peptidase II
MSALWMIALFAGTILLDQLTKVWVVAALKPVGSVWIWENVLRFTYVENTGAAFGILTEHR